MKPLQPRLEVICGPMFSGKSTELVRRLHRAELAGVPTLLLRPKIDDTKLTHDGIDRPCVRVPNHDWLFNDEQYITGHVVGIDEVQFLDKCLESILHMATNNVVICCGLDTTYRYEPFGIVPQLLAYAERIDKLTAVCVVCGKDATRTQRMVNGEPAFYDDPTILVGEEDFYEARCPDCWELQWRDSTFAPVHEYPPDTVSL